jgi:ATP-dependent 26S proteasome regulatory subunit
MCLFICSYVYMFICVYVYICICIYVSSGGFLTLSLILCMYVSIYVSMYLCMYVLYVGVDRTKYAIQIPLPPKIDPTVSLMEVEDKPDVTYDDVGGSKKALEQLREVVEIPLLHPERFVTLGIDPPKGVLLYGPPGTGKTLSARAVANRTDATFIRVIGSELVQRYVGEGARMVRELFSLARSKKCCIIFFDEVDAIGGARSSGEDNSDIEVQRTMLQIVTELDGFDSRGNIKVYKVYVCMYVCIYVCMYICMYMYIVYCI